MSEDPEEHEAQSELATESITAKVVRIERELRFLNDMRPPPAGQLQIKIEALRAAAVVCEGVAQTVDGKAPDSIAVADYVKHVATLLVPWLSES